MLTIISTSLSGKSKKVYLFENLWYGRCFEIGQLVETVAQVHSYLRARKRGRIVGFNRPICDGVVAEVLKVLFEGEAEPRDVKMSDVRIIKR